MPVTSIVALIAVFGPELVTRFGLDAVELLLSLRVGTFGTGAPPEQPNDAVVAELRKAKKIVPVAGGFRAAHIKIGDIDCFQRLATFGGGKPGQVSCVAKANILRRLRKRLIEESRYTAPMRANAEPDNFLDPERLAPGVDVHAECMTELTRFMAEAIRAYLAILERLFNLRLKPDDVQASIHQVELTWDTPCRVARHVPTALWPGWASSFRGAGRHLGFLEEGEKLVLRHRIGTKEHGPKVTFREAVLRAKDAKGNGAKLYVKTDRVIRFEAELTGERIAKLNDGRKAMLGDLAAVQALLERLAEGPYAALLRAQAALPSDAVLDFAEVICGFLAAGSRRLVPDIVRAFAAGDHFFNEGGRYEKELTHLRKKSWAVHLGRGEWVSTPVITATFAFYRWRTRGITATSFAAPAPKPRPAAARARSGTRRTTPTSPAVSGADDA